MGTRKSVDKILDQAADILEKRGYVTTMCYDPDTGGFCALGAIARAAYPKALVDEIDTIAYRGVDGDEHEEADPRYIEAVTTAARTITRRKTPPRYAGVVVYDYNDSVKSPKHVVKMLRRAADNARKAVSA